MHSTLVARLGNCPQGSESIYPTGSNTVEEEQFPVLCWHIWSTPVTELTRIKHSVFYSEYLKIVPRQWDSVCWPLLRPSALGDCALTCVFKNDLFRHFSCPGLRLFPLIREWNKTQTSQMWSRLTWIIDLLIQFPFLSFSLIHIICSGLMMNYRKQLFAAHRCSQWYHGHFSVA